ALPISCISTQRIFVHQSVYKQFVDLLLPKVKALKVGDVLDEKTEIGPVISLEAAERVEKWIKEAQEAGATKAIAEVNNSPYGLQAGVFTTNHNTMFRCYGELEVGAVNGNDIPGFRIDRLPYGGAKDSGLRREG